MEDKWYKDLEKMGLCCDRKKALGKEAHRQLLMIEGKTEKKKKLKDEYICLYCGEKSFDKGFIYRHIKCGNAIVVLKHEIECPLRPKEYRFFTVIYNGSIFRFEDYESSMRFRHLIWKRKMVIRDAMKCPDLKWFKGEGLKNWQAEAKNE